MSTALDFASLMRRAKSKKVAASASSVPPATLQTTMSGAKAVEIESFKIGSVPSVYYVPNFLQPDQETALINEIYADEKKWVDLSFRRLKTYGGIPSTNGTRIESLPPFIDAFIDGLISRGIPFPQRPNHILLNEYSAGMGIGAHFDGPQYDPYVAVLNLQAPAIFYILSPTKIDAATAATLSETHDGYAIIEKYYLEPRSLLVFTSDAYTKYKHGIPHALYDVVASCLQNSRYLSTDVCGKSVWRNGRTKLTDTEENDESARLWKPRLSLTIRRAIPAAGERMETASDREEERRDLINFYRSVSEYN